MKPNLFDFATSELSQDAMICWLLAWADPSGKLEDQKLHGLGVSVLAAVFSKFGRSVPVVRQVVKVHRQERHIDVIVLIDDWAVLCIEDKAGTTEHSDQLRRYREYTEQKYPGREIFPVYVQTSDQSSYQAVTQAGYVVLHRRELIDLLNDYKNLQGSNAIALDFLAYLSSIESAVESYSRCPISTWTDSSLVGFYAKLACDLQGAEWGYVANPRGGFIGLWWGWRCVGDCSLYAQLEPSYTECAHGYSVDALQLTFRIAVNDSADARDARIFWHQRVVDSARTMGVSVTKPKRFGTGSTMTVAVLAEDPRRTNECGVIDYPVTLENIRAAADLIATAAKHAEQEHASDPR